MAMRLVTFGQLHIANCEFTRTKHLLLLTYLALEGAKKRYELAEFFWEGLKEEKTNKGERKDLHNLSTTLSQIRKYVGKDSIENGKHKGEIQTSVSCDAKEFLQAFEAGKYDLAWSLYQSAFLYDIENTFKFHAFDNLYLWIADMREQFASMAQKALIELAKESLEKESYDQVRQFAELAHNLPAAPPLEPAMLSQVSYLLLAGGSPLAAKTNKAVDKFLEEAELSENALKLFLTLSLQEKVDFGVARTSLSISAKEASRVLGELVLAKLVGGGAEILAPDIASSYLDEHPELRLPLLLDLASATVKSQAFSVYQRIYEYDKTFGGLGYLQKAKIAYLSKAWEYAKEQDFQAAANMLKDIREAEERLQIDPDMEVRFLEVYALERMAYFKEALRLFEDINPEGKPRLLALKATLLMRLGEQKEAQELAQTALEQADDSTAGRWAKALALQCLGNVAYNLGNGDEAASLWRKTANYWFLLGETHRHVGVLNNLANALSRAGSHFDEIKAVFDEALELLDESEGNTFPKSHILISLGLTYVEWNQFEKAEQCYLEALTILKDSQLIDKALNQVAILYLNLGELYANQKKMGNARSYLKKAIDVSLLSGDGITQACTLADLACLKENSNLMHTALEIFTDNEAIPELEAYKPIYEDMLKKRLSQNLLQQQFHSVKYYGKQLMSFYQQQNAKEVQWLEQLLGLINKTLDPLQRKIEQELGGY